MQSWISIPENSDFTLENIPFGIVSLNGGQRQVATRLGDHIILLKKAYELGAFNGIEIDPTVFEEAFLNDFIGQGKKITNAVRMRLQKELSTDESSLNGNDDVVKSIQEVQTHLPVFVRDYTDFYSSIEHATNVGKMFRDPDNALLPNWKHLPVGYHGRASSIIESGVDIVRPCGQTKPQDGPPVYGPTKRLDFELEMAFIIGKNNELGEPIDINNAEDHIFGMVIFNDWSARDIQKWEYVPLGPFLGKSFASSISPWVVTMEALEPFRVPGPNQEPVVLPYLMYSGNKNYDIDLSVDLCPAEGEWNNICKSNYKYMYWNMAQQLAHHTVNGCNVSVGDMMASGTISGKDEHSYGSMLELSWSGKKPITLNDGTTRTFINDGDSIRMRAFAEKDGKRVGFGEVVSTVLPARN